jgi:hypothetical protein
MNLKSVLDVRFKLPVRLMRLTRGHRSPRHQTGKHNDSSRRVRQDSRFGIAKLIERHSESVEAKAATATKGLTRDGMIIGTASYMSPEQARVKIRMLEAIFSVSASCCTKRSRKAAV